MTKNSQPNKPATESGGEVLVNVEHVSKKFCRDLKKSLWYGVKDILGELDPRSRPGKDQGGHSVNGLRPSEFWANRDISFEVRRGECVGLIGHNGAGKTTLLKMLNGLIKPDEGRIEMRGRVGALIALGAGFNPILTGRENVYVNGSILGLSKKEIDAKLHNIIEFSEIGKFIDAPVQSYSSGMQVRLGFAVATALNPDVLILDEVLAVGDIAFQIKCGKRIRQIAKNAAVIFVSHSMQHVSLFCDRVMVMKAGKTVLDTTHPPEGIQRYFSIVPNLEEATGTLEAEVTGIRVWLPGKLPLEREMTMEQGQPLQLELSVNIQESCKSATLRVNILDEALTGIMTFPVVDAAGEPAVYPSGQHSLLLDLGDIELGLGKYSFLVGVTNFESRDVMLRHQGLHPFQISARELDSGAKVVRAVTAQVITPVH